MKFTPSMPIGFMHQTVSVRALRDALGLEPNNLHEWFKARIDRFKLFEGVDYVRFFVGLSSNDLPQYDYAITTDHAVLLLRYERTRTGRGKIALPVLDRLEAAITEMETEAAKPPRPLTFSDLRVALHDCLLKLNKYREHQEYVAKLEVTLERDRWLKLDNPRIELDYQLDDLRSRLEN